MLEGKVGIVTGAASGIGFAIAEMLVAQGVKTIMVDVNEERLNAAAIEISGIPYTCDLSKRESCKELAEMVISQHERVDILVNVAGVQNVSPVEKFPEDKWDFMISLMLTAPFLLTKYCWNSMKKQGWGRIIHLNSIHGIIASEFKSAYVSAKHGLMGLTKACAMEGGPFGITVNSICPAYVRTPLVDGQIADQARHHNMSEEQIIKEVMLSKAAIKNLLEPQTVAEAVKFLCSEAADNITGIALPIDGGWTAN